MTTLVLARPAGQLANLLFQYAHVVAAAADRRFTAAFPGFGPDAEHFPALAGDALCRWPAPRGAVPPRLRPAMTKAAAAALRAAGKLPGAASVVVPEGEERGLASFGVDARLIFVAGWGFREPEAFARHRDTVRRVFAPAEQHVAAARAAVDRARAGADVVVGVHRRQGDYAVWQGGRWFYTDEQYRAVMDRAAKALGGRVAFLLCSNESFDPDAMGASPGPGSAVADMAALSMCDYIVGPPSTFSMWASFMGEVPRHQLDDPDAPLTRDDFTPHLDG